MKLKGTLLITRIGSMLLDHAIMCMVIVPPLILIGALFSSNQPFENHPIETFSFYAGMIVYLNKDLFNGRSIAKRLLGLQVISNTDNLPANELRCFIRNLTIPFWPLEVLVTLLSPYKRIGDMVGGTRIVETEKKNLRSILDDIRDYKFSMTTVATLGFGVVYSLILWKLTEWLLPF
jgi:uncharacterized RDD family membrane protein YckC